MAHDPRREDYQRLSLRFAEELDKGDPADAARAFASFGRRFVLSDLPVCFYIDYGNALYLWI